MKLERRRSRLAVCNLCCASFRRKSIYTRFCDACRKGNELYRFADCWSGLDGHSAGSIPGEEDLLPVAEAWARA